MAEGIAILSMQKIINYGSFFQAYALRELIRRVSPNEKVVFIDIEYGRILEINTVQKVGKIQKIKTAILDGTIFHKAVESFKSRRFFRTLRRQFIKYFYPMLNLSEEDNKKKYRCVVIGSDEVFNACQNVPWGFSMQLMGNVKNCDFALSYAASFGDTTYEDIVRAGILQEITDSLAKLKAISVRDDNSKNIIEKALGVTPAMHLDPVLLFDFTAKIEESGHFFSSKKFLLVYSYSGRINDPCEIESIKNFAKKHDLKIYTVFCRYDWTDRTLMPESPFFVLSIFREAEYVVSDTFHGSIFSIITHRKFCTLVRDSNKEKVMSLLKKLNLQDHAVFDHSDLEDRICKDINYDAIDRLRADELKRTLKYLDDNLDEEK